MATLAETDLPVRYAQLLEKRIAQLEGLLSEAPKSPQSPKGDDTTKIKEPETTGAVKAGSDTVQNKENTAKDKTTDEEPKKEDASKPTTRYRNILRKWDRTAGAHKDEDVSEANFKKSDSKDVAYTFRRVYDPETGEKGAYSELDIEGEELIALLKSVIDNKYPGINFDGELVNISAPFTPIVSRNS